MLAELCQGLRSGTAERKRDQAGLCEEAQLWNGRGATVPDGDTLGRVLCLQSFLSS